MWLVRTYVMDEVSGEHRISGEFEGSRRLTERETEGYLCDDMSLIIE